MKVILNLFVLFAISLTLITSCEVRQATHRANKKHKTTVLVKSYQTHPIDSKSGSTSNDVLYWYIITSSNSSAGPGATYYTYSSPTPVSNFSSVNWSRSTELPASVEREFKGALEQEPQEIEVPVSELNAEMQQEIDLNAEYFEGMSTEEMGDYEGGDYSADGGSSARSEAEEDANNQNDTEASTESSSESSDSSSDSGGGDSGGGDGGGGGE